jgi:hypothetical protein
MTTINSTSAISSRFTDPSQDPSVFRMFLEFMSGDTAHAALQGMIGGGNDLVNTLQSRAAAMQELQSVTAGATMSPDLVSALNELGISVIDNPPTSADLATMNTELSDAQNQDEQSLTQVMSSLRDHASQWMSSTDATNQLLQQFAPSQPQSPTELDHSQDALDIVRQSANSPLDLQTNARNRSQTESAGGSRYSGLQNNANDAQQTICDDSQ